MGRGVRVIHSEDSRDLSNQEYLERICTNVLRQGMQVGFSLILSQKAFELIRPAEMQERVDGISLTWRVEYRDGGFWVEGPNYSHKFMQLGR